MDKSDYKILIINNEAIIAYSFFLELVNHGFTRVYFAQTYREALIIANVVRPFLVLQDIYFNQGNGQHLIREDDFCQYLKKKYRTEHIFISGYQKKYIKKTNPIAFLFIVPKKGILIESVERGFRRYNERIPQKAVSKYKANKAGQQCIRIMEMENRRIRSKVEIIDRMINSKRIGVLNIKD